MTEKLKFWKAVLKRELNIIRKDWDIIAIILLAPLFYSFFYGTIYLHKSETNVKIVIVDEDRSTLSRLIIRELDAHQAIAVSNVLPEFEQAKNRIYNLKAQAIVYIPRKFSQKIKSGRSASLELFINTSRFLVANDINKAVNQVVATFAGGIQIQTLQARGMNFSQARQYIQPLKTDIHPISNPSFSYGDFLIPGLLALILQQTLLIGFSQSVVRERETHSLQELYEMAGRNYFRLIFGKIVYYFGLFLAYAALFLTVHFSLLKQNFKGSLSAAIMLTSIFLLSVILISFFFSTFFKQKLIALQLFAFTSYPLFLLSGYSWPLFSMPAPLKVLSQLLPTTPYLQAIIRITQMGAGWGDIRPELLHLFLLSIVMLVATVVRLRILLKPNNR